MPLAGTRFCFSAVMLTISQKEKSGPFGPPLKRQEGRKISGKAMQDVVEAEARTIGSEKSISLEAG